MHGSDRRVLRRRKRLNVKFRDVVSDLDEDDEKVEVIRDSKLHLLKFDTRENDSGTNSATSVESSFNSMTGKIITANVEEINMRPRLEKSKSVPNFFFETPIMSLIRDLTFVKSQLGKESRLQGIIQNVLETLRKPETLTVARRISKIDGLDETWCHFASYSHKPYSLTPTPERSLFWSNSFRIPSTPMRSSLERTHSFDWLSGAKSKRFKRTNSDSAKEAKLFTWLPSLTVGKSLNNWNLDIFELAEETGQRPLTWLLVYIARERDWYNKFSFDETTLLNFCHEVEGGYSTEIPYHNNCHAADVVNSTYYLYSEASFAARFDELAFFSGIIAAAVHDLHHPGRTTRFLIHTRHPLAIRYNDAAILENMHLAEAFTILSKDECNIVKGLNPGEYNKFRKLVISAVLSTDLRSHLEGIREIKRNEQTLFSPIAEDTHEEMILCLGIKLADVGHAGKCRKLHMAWSAKIQEEFFLQGDEERDLGLDISKHMDRNKPSLADNQLGFFKYVALPLFQAVVETTYCPDKFVPLYQQLLDNEKYWLHMKGCS